MIYYQPEDGHNPVMFEDPIYRKPLQSLMIVKLTLGSEHVKWKLVQNLPKAKRQYIADQRRGASGDLKAASLIEQGW